MNRVKKLRHHLVCAPVMAKSNEIQKSKPKLLPGEIPALSVEDLRVRYGQASPDALEIDGVNHVAFVSADMARTVWFWNEILGLRLTKTIQLEDGGQHFFIEGGRGCQIAYFWWPNAPTKSPGISNVDLDAFISGNITTAHGSVNHVAFNVPAEKLVEYRKKIKSAGLKVTRILYHTDETDTGLAPEKDENTTWQSFYFSGPDGELIELTAQTCREFTPEQDIHHKPKGIKIKEEA